MGAAAIWYNGGMNAKTILSAIAAAAVQTAFCAADAAQNDLPLRIGSETEQAKAERMSWWTHDRFGMFIHFGLYAMPARHEWVQSREFIDAGTYEEKYFRRFDPDLFDAREWVGAARAAGMKYIVLTTKHHEGFCLWDTDQTDYKITRTPFGRDLVREFVDACREAGLKVGFYHSLIDWHHPDYRLDGTHPLRPRSGFTDESFAKLNESRSMERYRKYLFAQVEELLTRYGKIDIMWFDFTPKGKYGKTWRDWDAVELLKLSRRLQPGIIVDNRLGLDATDDGWDFVTPEQFKTEKWPTVRGRRVPWETCQTFSGSWGYHRDEATWKSSRQVIELLVDTVSMGGNLIMNVGPTARGTFDGRAAARLGAMAEWMRLCSRSIYGCTEAPAEFTPPADSRLTYNPGSGRLYVHLFAYPAGRLPISFGDRVEYAQFLHDASELKIAGLPDWQKHSVGDDGSGFAVILPVEKPPVEVPVVELFLRR